MSNDTFNIFIYSYFIHKLFTKIITNLFFITSDAWSIIILVKKDINKITISQNLKRIRLTPLEIVLYKYIFKVDFPKPLEQLLIFLFKLGVNF